MYYIQELKLIIANSPLLPTFLPSHQAAHPQRVKGSSLLPLLPWKPGLRHQVGCFSNSHLAVIRAPWGCMETSFARQQISAHSFLFFDV